MGVQYSTLWYHRTQWIVPEALQKSPIARVSESISVAGLVYAMQLAKTWASMA